MVEQSYETARAVINELLGRSGFDHWWYEIDGDIQDEIIDTIAFIIDCDDD